MNNKITNMCVAVIALLALATGTLGQDTRPFHGPPIQRDGIFI